MDFAKGHGTENDFVLLRDLDVAIDLSSSRVSALCDRRRGIGADGVLRIAKAGALRERGMLDLLPSGVSDDDWFMDYRNGDGSVAEMCGNGVRVFAHYLKSSGLESRDEFVVGSRAGARPVVVHSADNTDADVTVDMGVVRELGTSTAMVAGRKYDGVGIDVGNPHLACVDAEIDDYALRNLDLTVAPEFDSVMFPGGVNLEFVTVPAAGSVSMRVFERGVGETRSCGTGTVAAGAAALKFDGKDSGVVCVRVLGGEVEVAVSGGSATLRGPSMLVASGTISDSWWARLK